MEDKRTLLAFLLIGLILLAMPYYYELVSMNSHDTSEETEPLEVVQETKPDNQIPGEPTSPSVPAAIKPPPETNPEVEPPVGTIASTSSTGEFTPRDIRVRTPLQELVFSTAGGVLISARLPRYNRTEYETVELVPPGGRGLGLTLNNRQGARDLSHLEFLPDKEGLVLGPGEEGSLRLTADLGGGASIIKEFRFSGDRYALELDLEYAGLGDGWQVFLGWENGIGPTEKSQPSSLFGMGGAQIVRTVAFMNEERIQIDPEESQIDKGLLKWAGVINTYFFLAIAPLEDDHYNIELYGQTSGQDLYHWEGHSFRIGHRIGGSGKWQTLVYIGPLDYEHLATYERNLEQGIDLGWPIIRDISKVLLILFVSLHQYIPNYGWVLVLFAIGIKILVYPLTHKSYNSMAKMQEVQPKINALREKYKNDQQRLTQETMKLYKEEGVNPLGGCLPILLQMPIFFALYKLFYSIELRQEPFMLWIRDLSMPDEILIAGFGLHVLPLIFAVSQIFQSRMTMKDPKQAFMVYLMPVFMIFIFWSLPSGLVLYWTVFNVLTVLQQQLINHLKKGQTTPQPVPVPVKKRKN